METVAQPETFEMLFWSPAAPFHEGDILTFAQRQYRVTEILERSKCPVLRLFTRLKLAGPFHFEKQ